MMESDFGFSIAWLRTRNHNVSEPDLPAKSYEHLTEFSTVQFPIVQVYSRSTSISHGNLYCTAVIAVKAEWFLSAMVAARKISDVTA